MNRNIVVVDTNIAIKWAIKEKDSDLALALLNEWINQGKSIIAPALLGYEASNILYRHARYGILPLQDAWEALEEVILKVVELDFVQFSEMHKQAMNFADRFELPATYDAHYLALAEREDCELWTADSRMWKAVKDKLPWVHNLSEYSPS